MEENVIKKAPHEGEPSTIINIPKFEEKSKGLVLEIEFVKDILKNKKFKTKWLIEDFFIEEGVGILHSRPSGNKTNLGLKFFECVSTGHLFANQYRVKKGKCLYIAAEDSLGVKQRIRGIAEILETDSDFTKKEIKDFKNNIAVMDVKVGDLLLGVYDNFQGEKVPIYAYALFNRIMQCGKHFSFIIIDTLAQTLGDSVNNDIIGQNYMDAVRWLSKALHCFILIIAHESKTGELNTTMGTTKFTASADIELGTYYYAETEKDKKELKAKLANNEHPKLIKLYCTKPPKHGHKPEQVNMRLRVFHSLKEKDNFGRPITICRLDRDRSIHYTMSQYKASLGETYIDKDIEELKPRQKEENGDKKDILKDVFGDDILD